MKEQAAKRYFPLPAQLRYWFWWLISPAYRYQARYSAHCLTVAIERLRTSEAEVAEAEREVARADARERGRQYGEHYGI